MGRHLSFSGKYVWIWERYRPVILRLMMDAPESAQEYQFSSHEFKDSNNKREGGYAFKLIAYKSRSQNDIKKNLLAQDLLYVLRCSNTGEELMEKGIYQFEMDKHFKLRVTQIPLSPDQEDTEEETE